MEFQNLPDPARLTWLVGPPGAGKTTFAHTASHGFSRVVELPEMLSSLIDPPGIVRGVLQANSALVEMIRRLEFHPDNLQHAPLLVVAGLIPEASCLPILPNEAVWLLRPPRERWRKQLYNRPTDDPTNSQYTDYDYAESWYDRFDAWEERADVIAISTRFDPGKIGVVYF